MTDQPNRQPTDAYPLVCKMCGETIAITLAAHSDQPRALVPENVDHLILEHEKTCRGNT